MTSAAGGDAPPHECTGACELPSGRCLWEFIAAHDGGATLEQVSVEFRLTSERIRQIEALALRKVRAALEPAEELGDTGQGRAA